MSTAESTAEMIGLELARSPESAKEFKGKVAPDWCAGCGDFGVLNSLQRALFELGLKPHEILCVSGIGCSSNLPGYLNTYGMHTLHGRSLPVATGAKLGNHKLNVIATGGDGDGYGIGGNHLMHTARRNIDITYLVMNNQIYGLTTGQISPTSRPGMKTKSTPEGNLEYPINPITSAIMNGATYVARGYSADPKHLTELIKKGIEHKGFSLIDVFSPCVTFNKVNTYPWFRERVYMLEDEGYDPNDFMGAMEKALEFDERIPLGLLYQTERPTYEDTDPVLREGPLVDQPLGLDRAKLDALLAETM